MARQRVGRYLNAQSDKWRQVRTQQTTCYQDAACLETATLPQLAIFGACHAVLCTESASTSSALLAATAALCADPGGNENSTAWFVVHAPSQIALSLAEVFFAHRREVEALANYGTTFGTFAEKAAEHVERTSMRQSFSSTLIETVCSFIKDTLTQADNLDGSTAGAAHGLNPTLVLLHEMYLWFSACLPIHTHLPTASSLHNNVAAFGTETNWAAQRDKWIDVVKALTAAPLLANLKRHEDRYQHRRVSSLLLLQCYFQAFRLDRSVQDGGSQLPRKFLNTVKRVFLRHNDHVVRNCSTFVFRHIAYHASAVRGLLATLVFPNAALRSKSSEAELTPFNWEAINVPVLADFGLLLLDTAAEPDGFHFLLREIANGSSSVFVAEAYDSKDPDLFYFLFCASDGRWCVQRCAISGLLYETALPFFARAVFNSDSVSFGQVHIVRGGRCRQCSSSRNLENALSSRPRSNWSDSRVQTEIEQRWKWQNRASGRPTGAASRRRRMRVGGWLVLWHQVLNVLSHGHFSSAVFASTPVPHLTS